MTVEMGLTLAQRPNQQTALARLARTAGESLDLAPLSQAIYQGLQSLLAVDACYLALLTSDEQLDQTAVWLDGHASSKHAERLTALGREPCVRVQGEQVCCIGNSADPDKPSPCGGLLDPTFHSALTVPVLNDRTVYALLGVQSRRIAAYNADDMALMAQIATALTPAIRNALRYRQACEEEMRYRTLLEEAADAVLVVDVEGCFVEVNDAACTLLGYDRSQLLTNSIADIVRPQDRAGSIIRFRRRMIGQNNRFDYYVLRQNGQPIHVELRTTTVQIGGKLLCQAICRDLSERDALQAAHEREHHLYLASVRSLAATVDARDAYTHSHSQQVAFYCRRIAREMGLPAELTETIELAGLLHDIGKIAVPDPILQKPGRLTAEEWAIMRAHAAKGADILAAGGSPALAAIVPMVRAHHERWDGGGYPDGLSGPNIPLGATVIAVADAFDTITTARPYKAAGSLDAALAEIERSAGRQFQPDVAAAFVRAVRRDESAGAGYLDALAHGNEPGTSAIPRLTATLAPPPGSPVSPVSLSYQEQQRLAAHSRALYEISRGFVGENDEAAVLAATARLGQTYFGAECVYLFELLDASGQRIGPGSGRSAEISRFNAHWGWETNQPFTPFHLDMATAIPATRAMLSLSHPTAVPEVSAIAGPQLRMHLLERGWRSGIYIPLRAGDETLGALSIGYTSSHRNFVLADMELAEALGAAAARALAGLVLQQAEEQLRRQLAALERNNGMLTRRSRDLAVINQTAQSLVAILDVDQLCNRTVEVLAATFGYRLVSIALREGDGMRFQAWIGYDVAPSPRFWPASSGIAGRVLRSGQPALVTDVSADPDYVPLQIGIRSELCVPLTSSKEVVGVLNVESDAVDPLDDNDLQLLLTLAPQITIALENARLYAAARRQATQLALINRIAHEITGLIAATDLATLLDNAAALLQRELGYTNVSIMLADPADGALVCHASAGEYTAAIYVGYRQAAGIGLVGWVAAHGRTLVANDVTQEPRFIQVTPVETPAAETVVPLIHGGRVIGVLDAESAQRDSFQPSDVQILETLADQLAFAVAQARIAALER